MNKVPLIISCLVGVMSALFGVEMVDFLILLTVYILGGVTGIIEAKRLKF